MPTEVLSGLVPRQRVDLGKYPGGKVTIILTGGKPAVTSLGLRPPLYQRICLRVPANINGDKHVAVDYALVDDQGHVFFPHLSGFPKRLTDIPRTLRMGAELSSLILDSGSGGKNACCEFQGPFRIVELHLVTKTKPVVPEALLEEDALED